MLDAVIQGRLRATGSVDTNSMIFLVGGQASIFTSKSNLLRKMEEISEGPSLASDDNNYWKLFFTVSWMLLLCLF
jgi:hypothetical protein